MNLDNFKNKTAKILLDIKAINFQPKKPFKLTSGKLSPVYVDCRKIISHLKERRSIINMGSTLLKKKVDLKKIDYIAGGETAGIPYASWISEKLNKPMIYIRKKPKGFGKNQQIEGNFIDSQKAILIDDLATDGGSKVIFIEVLRKFNINVSDIFVIFYYDIFDISKTPLATLNVKIHYLCKWKNIIDIVQKNEILSNNEIENLQFFLNEPEKWRQMHE